VDRSISLIITPKPVMVFLFVDILTILINLLTKTNGWNMVNLYKFIYFCYFHKSPSNSLKMKISVKITNRMTFHFIKRVK
jgi:hypothetical protein